MTVMQVGDGELAVPSAIRMREADMERLDAIGRVAYVIAPNPLHASEAPWYAQRYPKAMTLIPAGMRRKQERRMRVNGTIENGSILIRNGKIAEVGTNISAPRGAHVIDAQGQYVIPGIIDAHSHIAGGSNEGSVAVSAMVVRRIS